VATARSGSALSSIILGIGEGLLGDEDTIEELTLVLLADLADLANAGARLGEEADVSAVEDELILNLLVGEDGAAVVELDKVGLLTAEEVLDLDGLAVLRNKSSDGEMRMHKSHLVSEALSNTNDHVVDVGLDGGDGTSLSVGTVPHLDADVLALILSSLHVHDLDVKGDVREVLEVGASGARNGDLSSLGLDLDYREKSGLECLFDALLKHQYERRSLSLIGLKRSF